MLEVSPIELYRFLDSKKYNYFYHANTIRTSCSLIESNGLLSRGEMESRSLPMSPQSSDEIDKKFDVWNDIFFDLLDLHGYFPRQNYYGPVCFKMSKEFLLDKDLQNICITKNNPIYWKDKMSLEEKYYSSVDEYISEFESNMRNKVIQTKMFTIHNTSKIIPFNKYLVEILLDNPPLRLGELSLFNVARQELLTSLENARMNPHILKVRTCLNCLCIHNYLNKKGRENLKRMILS